ncbi:MAG: sigma-E factor negative regulatory protein [Pseudoxanthomonas sp.]|nr:sigma-E factor negative regulatory protein [Pseudoxanthomonas sp.]MBP9644636.1 sigma-E factor negative regulatory protein [Pseudoxanthomonas sp.]
MNHDPDPGHDKLDLHQRQQLSALVDGELAPDQARFLLRRLQHDAELSERFERWQLCGDVLRGQVRRTAAPELAGRIAAAIAAAPAAEARATPVRSQAGSTRGPAWTRWAGGAALAASVAAVAMFVARPAVTDPAFAPAPALAVQALPATEAVLAQAAPQPLEGGAMQRPQPRAVTPRSQPRAPAATTVAMATPRARVRDQAVFAEVVAEADGQLPAAGVGLEDPFASPAPLQARPWPRATLAAPSGRSYTAGFGDPAATASFYPFEPRLSHPATDDGHARPVPAHEDRQP